MEYNELMFPNLKFMVDPTINLISGPHYECERRKDLGGKDFREKEFKLWGYQHSVIISLKKNLLEFDIR